MTPGVVTEGLGMTSYLLQAMGELALLLLGGVLVAWLMRSAEQLVQLSPLPPSVKASVLRYMPALELVVAVAYLASGLAVLTVHEPIFASILITLVLLIIIFAWPSLYDLISGVFFRVRQPCEVGDSVRMDDVEGRVVEVGTRGLVLQTREGDEAMIPYGRLARQTLRRTQLVSGTHIHAFQVQPPAGKDFAEIKRLVLQATIQCHWASVIHEPKVERRATFIEVSVYAHDVDHAPHVEAAVRAALGSATPAPAIDDLFVDDAKPAPRKPLVPPWPGQAP